MCKNPNFWHLLPLNPRIKIFFQNFGRVTFLINWPLTSCKSSEKSNEQSLRYLKTGGQTDGRTDQRTREITKDPLGSGRPGVQNKWNDVAEKIKTVKQKMNDHGCPNFAGKSFARLFQAMQKNISKVAWIFTLQFSSLGVGNQCING